MVSAQVAKVSGSNQTSQIIKTNNISTSSSFSETTEVKKCTQTLKTSVVESSNMERSTEDVVPMSKSIQSHANGFVSISDITDEYNSRSNANLQKSSSKQSVKLHNEVVASTSISTETKTEMTSSSSKTLTNGYINGVVHAQDRKGQMEEHRRSVHSSRETLVSGQKFNISTGLVKTSRYSSREDVRENRSSEIGGHLKGLDLALEELTKNQKTQSSQVFRSSHHVLFI